jgi:ketosteroid isomerase-like protein
MSKWLWRVGALTLLAGLGYWGWGVLFPHPEQAIRKRLNELARAASFSGGEGALVKVAKAQAVTAFCTEDVAIIVEVPGYPRQEIHGTAELLQAAAAIRTYREGFKVQFFDIVVKVAPDQKTAVADLTARGDVPRERDFSVQELRFKLKKVDGKWLVSHVETVQPLSR